MKLSDYVAVFKEHASRGEPYVLSSLECKEVSGHIEDFVREVYGLAKHTAAACLETTGSSADSLLALWEQK